MSVLVESAILNAISPSRVPRSKTFDFYGAGLILVSSAPDLLDSLSRDFDYFAAQAPKGAIKVVAHADEPPWNEVPNRIASMTTPNAICYDDAETRYTDYYRLALGKYDFAHESGEIWSRDLDLLYELTYLMALSRVGESHDHKGIHRVHALGVAIAGKGGLVLLPEGGGKTTLALELLTRPRVKILSDDTPLYADGELWAFPSRMGIRGKVEGIPPEHLRAFRRRNHGPKTLVDLAYFRERVIDHVVPKILIVGVRSSGENSFVEPIARTKAFPALAQNLVFGVGLPQVLEYFLRSGLRDLFRKSRIAQSRLRSAVRLLGQTACYRLVLGRDVVAAADAVASLLTP